MNAVAIVTTEPLEAQPLRAACAADEYGAVLLFEGVVRDHDGGRSVSALDYEAHPDAERFLASCVAEESARTGVALAAAHRVGPLAIGDRALLAVAASAHRREAFEALQSLIERIKSEVPIWKRQHFEDGVSEWVNL